MTGGDLDRFLLRVIHDLRVPLRQAALQAQILQRFAGGKVGSEGESQIATILEAHRHAGEFLTRLSDYCQAGFGLPELPPVSAGILLARAMRSFEQTEPDVLIDVDAMPDALVPVSLQKVFSELLDNARKFRKGPVRIRIGGRSQGSECFFEIWDDGIGIEPQYAEIVWEPLERLHGPQEYPGVGLGLAICRRIVTALGGRIWADQAPGGGSIFSFSVPAL